jgi:cardiolipin synthase A/B
MVSNIESSSREIGNQIAAMDLFNGTHWGSLYVASEWIIRIVMLVVVPFRRSPDAAKGWLLLVLFLPWVGLTLYLLIGRPTYPRWRTERFAKLPDALKPMHQLLEKNLRPFSVELPEPLASTAALVRNLGRFRPVGRNEVSFLWKYDATIDQIVADIDRATNHIHVLYYIFSDDTSGRKVMAALERAVKRGVAARVLVDYIGSGRWWRRVFKRLSAAGVSVHRVLPVGFFRRKSARADLRNHRKIVVIDGRVGYTGSQNLVDSKSKPGITYEEMVARVTGPVVLQFQAIFIGDWYMETEEILDAPDLFPSPEATGDVVAQALPGGPDYPSSNMLEFVLALIYSARKRIVVTTPYFIPDKSLLDALDTAVRRGVEVDLVVSTQTDLMIAGLAQKSYYEELLESRVRIHLYEKRFLHAKHLTIDDDLAVVGSSNMDIRSFILNAEVSLLVFDREATSCLKEQQERCFAKCKRFTLEDWSSRSLASKVLQNFARLLSPLL